MKLIKVEGIVVGEQNYLETSKILKIFTKDLGIISVLSKGCKKPKSDLREGSNKLIRAVFNISYKDNGLSTLTGVDIIDNYKNIVMDYKDLAKKMYSFTVIDLAIQVVNQRQIEKEEISNIYNILISAIKKIDEGFSSEIILDIVMLKYLDFLGVAPSIDSCANCGSNDNIVTMDSKSFGFICKDCYKDEQIVSNEALKLVRMLYYVDIDRIKKLELKEEYQEVHKFIEEYYEEHTGIYFNIKNKVNTLKKIEGVI